VPIRAPAGARPLTALFTNLSAVTRTVFNASTGWIVEQTGWFRLPDLRRGEPSSFL